jgi:7,8-dihydropterin-6-yl-methyl-4-(beta-D-ribofuranosyl)aminobenzene 5'-phosphate synthase
MKLSVLSENTASAHFTAEHGLSYFIEYDNKKILFDTGASNLFLKNAEKMDIDLSQIDSVILSHGHWDHGNGLRYIKEKQLICHPEVFNKRYKKNEKENIGLAMSYEEINAQFSLTLSKEPINISPKIIFLGEIPFTFGFEERTTSFVLENGEIDFIRDDSALAIIINNELVIVSGCAHSGICNITEYAKDLTGIKKIKAVIGGFHLKHQNYQTKKTVDYLKDNNVQHVLPSHCTELPALSLFFKSFKIDQVKTGMVFNF